MEDEIRYRETQEDLERMVAYEEVIFQAETAEEERRLEEAQEGLRAAAMTDQLAIEEHEARFEEDVHPDLIDLTDGVSSSDTEAHLRACRLVWEEVAAHEEMDPLGEDFGEDSAPALAADDFGEDSAPALAADGGGRQMASARSALS